jgi:hypothetical protein
LRDGGGRCSCDCRAPHRAPAIKPSCTPPPFPRARQLLSHPTTASRIELLRGAASALLLDAPAAAGDGPDGAEHRQCVVALSFGAVFVAWAAALFLAARAQHRAARAPLAGAAMGGGAAGHGSPAAPWERRAGELAAHALTGGSGFTGQGVAVLAGAAATAWAAAELIAPLLAGVRDGPHCPAFA